MKGNKRWANTWTEVEDLGGGKFGATISVGHRVFFDKADGNKPKKHKLTDERPSKDYVLIQGPKCCVEVYPYYSKYFDVQHEEVRLYEERWVVQRWRDPPGKWFDVGAWNPVIAIEEYSEPAGDVVKVTITYDTDYGTLIVEYFQRDGNNLKYNVAFKNTSGSTETFRVVQKWAGIVGAKCNDKELPLNIDEPFLAFHRADKSRKEFTIAENLSGMIFNEDGSEKTNQCLQRPVKVEGHAQGMKADFIYSQWVLAQNETLAIDPDTATLSPPTEDGWIEHDGEIPAVYTRHNTDATIQIYYALVGDKRGNGYVEWDISSIPDGATITDTVFKYHGCSHNSDAKIREMVGARPSTASDKDTFDEVIEGTIYADPAGFPVVGTNKEQDLGSDADTDLANQLSADWFAIGFEGEGMPVSTIYSDEKTDAANPKPTLYVEYTPLAGWSGKISGVTNPAKVMGVDVANIAKIKGVASA